MLFARAQVAMTTKPIVYVVDDDPQVRESLELFVRSVGLDVRTYASAEEFLDDYTDSPAPPRCLVLDVRMPGLSGPGLQERLVKDGIHIPTVMITGYANVPMAVQAMRSGAVYFLEKPVSRQALLERIQEAIDQDAAARHEQARRAEVVARVTRLSQREREVMDLLIVGKHAKQIAAELGISEKTVAKHRARVFEKMEVDSIAQLVRQSWLLENAPRALPNSRRPGVEGPP
jgi:two-component system response regulator FixJ